MAHPDEELPLHLYGLPANLTSDASVWQPMYLKDEDAEDVTDEPDSD